MDYTFAGILPSEYLDVFEAATNRTDDSLKCRLFEEQCVEYIKLLIRHEPSFRKHDWQKFKAFLENNFKDSPDSNDFIEIDSTTKYPVSPGNLLAMVTTFQARISNINFGEDDVEHFFMKNFASFSRFIVKYGEKLVNKGEVTWPDILLLFLSIIPIKIRIHLFKADNSIVEYFRNLEKYIWEPDHAKEVVLKSAEMAVCFDAVQLLLGKSKKIDEQYAMLANGWKRHSKSIPPLKLFEIWEPITAQALDLKLIDQVQGLRSLTKCLPEILAENLLYDILGMPLPSYDQEMADEDDDNSQIASTGDQKDEDTPQTPFWLNEVDDNSNNPWKKTTIKIKEYIKHNYISSKDINILLNDIRKRKPRNGLISDDILLFECDSKSKQHCKAKEFLQICLCSEHSDDNDIKDDYKGDNETEILSDDLRDIFTLVNKNSLELKHLINPYCQITNGLIKKRLMTSREQHILALNFMPEPVKDVFIIDLPNDVKDWLTSGGKQPCVENLKRYFDTVIEFPLKRWIPEYRIKRAVNKFELLSWGEGFPSGESSILWKEVPTKSRSIQTRCKFCDKYYHQMTDCKLLKEYQESYRFEIHKAGGGNSEVIETMDGRMFYPTVPGSGGIIRSKLFTKYIGSLLSVDQ